MFDAGEGGSWNVLVHGGATEVVLVCKKGYRVEKYGMIRTVCTDGHWAGDVSRCVPDVDHCDAGNPKALDTEVVKGRGRQSSAIVKDCTIRFTAVYLSEHQEN